MDDETQDSLEVKRLEAVRDKLNITWESESTDRRVRSVIDTVTSTLNARLGYESLHEFCPDDGGSWGLFLNGCLYEFSDAMDDFYVNYAEELRCCRLLNVTLPKDDEDAED